MALGQLTLTIKINAVDKILKRINQDNFATRYYLRETLGAYTANIRQSNETRGGVKYEVHNVELIHEVFATLTEPAKIRTVWYTIRNTKNDDFAAVGYLAIALADLVKVTGNVDDLLSLVS